MGHMCFEPLPHLTDQARLLKNIIEERKLMAINFVNNFEEN